MAVLLAAARALRLDIFIWFLPNSVDDKRVASLTLSDRSLDQFGGAAACGRLYRVQVGLGPKGDH
jgi:hypothetical protein